MKKTFTKIIFIAACINIPGAYAQNLIPNPGFEIQDSCPQVSQIQLAPPWDSPQSGSPDLYNSTCPTQNFFGRTGIGSSGIFCYIAASTDNREYLQAPLLTTLIPGHIYCVSFYVKHSSYKYAVDRMGAYFSTGAIHISMNTSYLPYTPQVENPPGNALSASGWILVSGSFTAGGTEDNIIIGNFSPDAQTTATVINSGSTSNVSYYYIDDIEVIDCTFGAVENVSLADAISVFPDPSGDKIEINIPSTNKLMDVRLFNATGQNITTKISAKQNCNVQINLGNHTAGIYFLQMDVDGYMITKKVMLM